MTETHETFSDQVFHYLLSMIRYTRQYGRQIIQESDLTPREFSVLLFLLETGSAAVGQVQAFVHRSPSTTSVMIAQLEEKGYVTRSRSPEDNRVVIVELTPFGQEVAENTPLGGLTLLCRLLSQLTEKRLAEIDGVLTEIMQLMKVSESE